MGSGVTIWNLHSPLVPPSGKNMSAVRFKMADICYNKLLRHTEVPNSKYVARKVLLTIRLLHDFSLGHSRDMKNHGDA